MNRITLCIVFLLALLMGCSPNTENEHTKVEQLVKKAEVVSKQQKNESDNIVNALEYFPLDKKISYTVKDNLGLRYVISHQGKKTIEGKEVYAINRAKVLNDGGKEEVTYLYSVDENNNILHQGSISNNQVSWEGKPYPFLFGKMELKKEYKVTRGSDSFPGKIKAAAFEDVVLSDRTFKNCLVVQTDFEVDGKIAFSYKYYLHKDVGIVKEISNENFDMEEVFESMGDIRKEKKK